MFYQVTLFFSPKCLFQMFEVHWHGCLCLSVDSYYLRNKPLIDEVDADIKEQSFFFVLFFFYHKGAGFILPYFLTLFYSSSKQNTRYPSLKIFTHSLILNHLFFHSASPFPLWTLIQLNVSLEHCERVGQDETLLPSVLYFLALFASLS